MKKFLQLFAVLAVMLMALAALADPLSEVNWEDSTITVRGTGVAPPNAVNDTQRRAMARRTAVIDGYRQLAEVVRGVQVDSESTVENFILINDTITAKVNAVVQGARVIDEREIDGGYEVTLRISMFGESQSLAGAVMPTSYKVESFPIPVSYVAPTMPAYDLNDPISVRIEAVNQQPTLPEVPAAPPTTPTVDYSSSEAIGGYTGLIVDCSGLNLNPCMSPVIKNANKEPIYGHKNLDPDYVIANGMASYTDNLYSGTTRAGNNPLVVRAVSLENHGFYPVISVADANRVLIENQTSRFLDETNVVFVK